MDPLRDVARFILGGIAAAALFIWIAFVVAVAFEGLDADIAVFAVILTVVAFGLGVAPIVFLRRHPIFWGGFVAGGIVIAAIWID